MRSRKVVAEGAFRPEAVCGEWLLSSRQVPPGQGGPDSADMPGEKFPWCPTSNGLALFGAPLVFITKPARQLIGTKTCFNLPTGMKTSPSSQIGLLQHDRPSLQVRSMRSESLYKVPSARLQEPPLAEARFWGIQLKERVR